MIFVNKPPQNVTQVELLKTCSIIKIPKRDSYTDLEYRVLNDLMEISLICNPDELIFVLPDEVPGIDMKAVWMNIVNFFGAVTYVKKVC